MFFQCKRLANQKFCPPRNEIMLFHSTTSHRMKFKWETLISQRLRGHAMSDILAIRTWRPGFSLAVSYLQRGCQWSRTRKSCCATSLATPLPDTTILSQPLQLLSRLPSSCLQSGFTNRRMSEKWAPIKQQTTITITNHYRRQTCSCCPVFHRRSNWTTLSTQELIWNKPLSLQWLNMLYNRNETLSQFQVSSIQLAIKQLPTCRSQICQQRFLQFWHR